ncbi:MAG: O-methyltransferase [Acinetobacter sp.]
MSNALWDIVDHYFNEHLLIEDDALQHALTSSHAANLPSFNVAANQGKLLQLLAQIQGATRILEIGTLGGYSTIWLARALPAHGQLITLELEPHHARIAQDNIAYAGLTEQVSILVGNARQSLQQLVNEQQTAFDFIFIDADKPSSTIYFKFALQLSRIGTVIVFDNVVREGKVVNHDSQDDRVLGVRQLVDELAQEKRIQATALQTVGTKGYDGIIIARVIA